MAMIFEQIKTDGIAQLSYLIGDDDSQTAAVIDPQPNAAIYLELARRHGLTITHVFETHIHADFMSGARSLVHRLGEAAHCASVEGGAQYDFTIHGVRDGDVFAFGSIRLTARHTPGHTPEHIAYFVAEADSVEDPWGVFTGDSLFVGSAGRPDLLGEEQTDDLVAALLRTLREVYLPLDDGVIILPGHGAGSACGADIGARPFSTIGLERRTNRFLQFDDQEAFSRFVTETAPPEPNHYRRLKSFNAAGPHILTALPSAPGLPPGRFKSLIKRPGVQLVDTRHMLAFGGGHIEGAINIGGRPELSVWAGQMLDPQNPILLVVEDESDLERILWHFAYTGFMNVVGHLAGGMRAWEDAGLPLQRLPQISIHELREQLNEGQLIDARAPSEWNQGRIPGAIHLYVADLRDGKANAALNGLRKDHPVTVYCNSGYRADIAASILQARGFRDVRNVPGSWQAWRSAGYEIEN